MRRLQIRQLDRELKEWYRIRSRNAPRRGWARAIREALGMQVQQLAERLGVSPAAITAFEKREADGTINIRSLRKLAEALESDLVYSIVPRQNLEKTVTDRAKKLASELMTEVAHSMRLEDQAVGKRVTREQTNELAQRILAESPERIWDQDAS